jgi:uncharacterized protein
MTTVGILSDTHLTTCCSAFQTAVLSVFNACDVIIHAGDLTDLSILDAFKGKQLHAVHGNMCSQASRQMLPEYMTITLYGYSIGICHGFGPRHNIEERMLHRFPEVDCIIYGHTHVPACHMYNGILFINPGSFQGTGKYGAQGTYGLLHIGAAGLHGTIHHLQTP